MKIRGLNVSGVRALCSATKKLSGCGNFFEVMLPVNGGALELHEHCDCNSWTKYDPEKMIFVGHFSKPYTMKEITKVISYWIDYHDFMI